MADSLGAVLAGINSGVGNGLDIYKTLQGEERQKRQDRLELERNAVSDQRYAQGVNTDAERYKDGQAAGVASLALAAKNRDEDQTYRTSRDAQAQKNSDADRALRSQEIAATRAGRTATVNAAGAKAQRVNDKTHIGMLQGAATGDNAADNVISTFNQNPGALEAYARTVGMAAPPGSLNGVYARRGGKDGEVMMLVTKGADGKEVGFDPDGPDGPLGTISFPTNSILRNLAGGTAADAVDAQTELSGRNRSLASAQYMQDTAVPTPPRAAAPSMGDTKQAALDASSVGQQVAALDQADAAALAKRAASPAMVRMAALDSESAAREAERAALPVRVDPRKAYAAAKADINAGRASEQAQANGEAAIASVAARTQQDTKADYQTALAGIESLPTKDRSGALKHLEGFKDSDLYLAARYPNTSAPAAQQKFTADVATFAKKLASDVGTSLPGKGSSDSGRPYPGKNMGSVSGGKLQVAFTKMAPRDQLLAMSFPKGQAAVTAAAVQAMEAERPEAMGFFLRASAAELDGKAVFAIMQDPALLDMKLNDDGRYAFAEKATKLMQATGISREEAIAKTAQK
jgi:hypothetical protein